MQKFRVSGFDCSQFTEDFIKSHNEENDEGYFLKVHVQSPETLHNLYNDLPFLPEKMKIGKVKKLVANLHDKAEYVIHTTNLKSALNHGVDLKKLHRITKFKQKAWLKSNIDMNIDLRKKAKNYFGKDFLKLMNNASLGKNMENIRKHNDIKLVTTKKRRNYIIILQSFSQNIY